ncbi:MAG: ABC transporter ATP-binding protein [Betaproteobacteria bacterium]|nr:ABC transporter ATP-binding protein [Betaproteobacteria bacterium]MDE2123138.1 ABC transporter ATP-binding protein [Betaproteobacteria bacterium]MDE2185566.1 ABC transporter ATP-binding protein [Betaproteobacteria bacterium]
MNSLATLLAADRLDVRVGSRLLLRQLSMQVRRGERWAVLGRNGAGKSTLLRQLAGLGVAPAPVLLGGAALSTLSPRALAQQRAFLPSQPRDRFGIAVLHAVTLAQHRVDDAMAMDCLRRVDAAHLAHRHVLQLSAGERQRVALAQVLAQRTPLLLLDEPVSFQDPAHQGLVARLLRGLPQQGIVFAAHDVNWVAHVATHVLGLVPGGQWIAGPVDQTLQAHHLQRLYGCDWQRVARQDGPDVWLPV